jgi:hypothetical protein
MEWEQLMGEGRGHPGTDVQEVVGFRSEPPDDEVVERTSASERDDDDGPESSGWTEVLWPRRRRWVLAVVVGLVALLVVPMTLSDAPPRPAQAVEVGAALTEHSADAWNPRSATDRAKQILRRVTDLGNQHIMGWGALNPSPSPGERQWDSLDARIRLIESAGVTPVITLCCAPDWMKGGVPGETDWSQIEVAPDPEHFGDFAALAVDVARRYPEVRRFVVWNELKGFYDPVRGRWDIESYTELYNMVYAALKAYDPTIAVGGPYVSLDSWSSAGAASNPSSVFGQWGVLDQRSLDAVDYWLAHATGADFLAVDGSNATEDAGLITDPVLANEKFTAATRWLVARTPLPVWWMELYPDVLPEEKADSPYAADVALDAILRIGDAGGEAVFIWQPEADPTFDSVALWDSTESLDGGQRRPLADRLEELRDIWSSGSAAEYVWQGDRLVLTALPPE